MRRHLITRACETCGAEFTPPHYEVAAGHGRFCCHPCWAESRKGPRLGAVLHSRRATPEYSVWADMLQRCGNPRSSNYPRYGARGISVCAAWHDFEVFYAELGPRPSAKHSLDRIDTNGHYEPSNCRWALRKTQQNNTRANVFLEYQGKRQTVKQWAEETGITVETLRARLNRLGWSAEKTLSTPAGPYKTARVRKCRS